MKIIGVDFGDARVGLAATDPGGIIAGAVGVLQVRGLEDAAEKTAAEVLRLGGQLVAVGRPLTASGKDEYRSDKTERFAQLLRDKTGLKVELFDERYTTVEAGRYLSEGNVHGKKRKRVLDSVAAQIMLQAYADSLRR